MRTFLRRILEGQGYSTEEATNGNQALALMKNRFYDIVFLDLEMPVSLKDGSESRKLIAM